MSCAHVQGQKAGKVNRSRGDPEPMHPEALVAAQPWFEDGAGYNRLAKNVRLKNVDVWELRSVIELVDILLWPYVKQCKGKSSHIRAHSLLRLKFFKRHPWQSLSVQRFEYRRALNEPAGFFPQISLHADS